MEKANKNLLLSPIIAWVFLGIHYFSVIYWIINGLGDNPSYMVLGMIFAVVIINWFIFISDAILSKIYNKGIWIILLIVMSTIAMPLYLIRRKKLLLMQREL